MSSDSRQQTNPASNQTNRDEADLPLISVIIPCFNGADHLAAAIESAMALDWQNKEIIVVDDGSTDSSAAIASAYTPGITLLRTPNRGPSSARNTGFRASKGEFIQFLDADDLLHPEKLTRQTVPLISGQADATVCQNADLLQDGVLIPSPVVQPAIADDADPFVHFVNHPVQTNALLVRRSNLERIGCFREGLRNSDETDLVFRLAASGTRWALVDQELFTIRHHDGPFRIANSIYAGRRLNEHGRIHTEALRFRLNVRMSLYEILESDTIYEFDAGRGEALGSVILQTAIYNWRDGDRDSARDAFRFLSDRKLCPPYHERRIYKLAARLLGHQATEFALETARRVFRRR